MTNVLILTYWDYSDALIQTYTLPYVRIIRKNLPGDCSIFLLTLEKKPRRIDGEQAEIVRRSLEREGITWMPFQYKPFGFVAFLLWIKISFRLCWLILSKKISVIHCWCTPAGAIGYILATLLSRKLVIDSYEPHAEAMVENGTWKKNSFAFRLLFWLEKRQSKRADVIVAATSGMHRYAVRKYNVTIHKFYVKPACVDLELFSREVVKDKELLHALELSNKVVCVYAGKFGGIYLEKEIFEFLKAASSYWGDSFATLLLTSHSREEITGFCNEVGLNPDIIISFFVKHDQIPRYIGLGDFALTPVKPIPTKRYCTPIKDGEYWALGLPVVIPANISNDSEIIFENNIGAVLESFDTASYQQALKQIDRLLMQPKEEMSAKIRAVAVRYRSFEIAEKVYREIYGRGV